MGNQECLSPMDAYRAMISFLEAYQDRGPSEEIAILLGGLDLNREGLPMDPAYWDDWMTAIERVRGRSV